MPAAEVLEEAAAAAEEVAAAGEIVGPVDLTTVSQQLDQVITWQAVNFAGTCVLVGVLLGAVLAKVVGRLWR